MLFAGCRLLALGKPIQTLQHFTPVFRSLSATVKSKPKLLLQNLRQFATKNKLPFEVDSNVSRDVLLFTFRNDKHFKMMTVFGVVNFVVWTYIGIFAFRMLKDAPVTPPKKGESLPWYQRINLGSNTYRNGITLICFAMGYLILTYTMLVPMRTVQTLALLKGGKKVGLRTYGPFAKTFSFVIPIEHISAMQARTSAGRIVSLKVKNRWFFFMMDKKGQFHNTQLFDYVVGLRRF
ncbi:unnamed protein product [Owenia fusiformis]|uniref:Uncharacterized protein n=1 Tax=Owenia fusiformis TaxID=6347 RepID=A0A8J1U7I6_OWEFU|nr:unnamed protein product [Owenia fusiformis]